MDIRKELTSKLVPPPGKVQQSKTTFNASRGLALSAIGANVRSSPMAIKAAIKNASDAELKKAYELCAGIKESDHVMDLILQRLNVDEETRERVGKKTDTGGLSRARRLPSGSSKETKRDFARRVHRDKYQDPLERKSQIRKEKSAEKKRMSKRKETFGEGLSPEKKEKREASRGPAGRAGTRVYKSPTPGHVPGTPGYKKGKLQASRPAKTASKEQKRQAARDSGRQKFDKLDNMTFNDRLAQNLMKRLDKKTKTTNESSMGKSTPKENMFNRRQVRRKLTAKQMKIQKNRDARDSEESDREFYSRTKKKKVNEAVDGWIAIYNGKRIEISKSEVNGIYGAKQKAIKDLKVPKSKIGLLSITPAVNEASTQHPMMKATDDIRRNAMSSQREFERKERERMSKKPLKKIAGNNYLANLLKKAEEKRQATKKDSTNEGVVRVIKGKKSTMDKETKKSVELLKRKREDADIQKSFDRWTDKRARDKAAKDYPDRYGKKKVNEDPIHEANSKTIEINSGSVGKIGKRTRGGNVEYFWTDRKSGLKNVSAGKNAILKFRQALRNDANYAGAEKAITQLEESFINTNIKGFRESTDINERLTGEKKKAREAARRISGRYHGSGRAGKYEREAGPLSPRRATRPAADASKSDKRHASRSAAYPRTSEPNEKGLNINDPLTLNKMTRDYAKDHRSDPATKSKIIRVAKKNIAKNKTAKKSNRLREELEEALTLDSLKSTGGKDKVFDDLLVKAITAVSKGDLKDGVKIANEIVKVMKDRNIPMTPKQKQSLQMLNTLANKR